MYREKRKRGPVSKRQKASIEKAKHGEQMYKADAASKSPFSTSHLSYLAVSSAIAMVDPAPPSISPTVGHPDPHIRKEDLIGNNPAQYSRYPAVAAAKMAAAPSYPQAYNSKLANAQQHSTLLQKHEKRCCSVFFTIFKNYQKDENPWTWCWFGFQVEKLRKHLVGNNAVAMIERLDTWLHLVDSSFKVNEHLLNSKCAFAPNLCSTCSTLAMGGGGVSCVITMYFSYIYSDLTFE